MPESLPPQSQTNAISLPVPCDCHLNIAARLQLLEEYGSVIENIQII